MWDATTGCISRNKKLHTVNSANQHAEPTKLNNLLKVGFVSAHLSSWGQRVSLQMSSWQIYSRLHPASDFIKHSRDSSFKPHCPALLAHCGPWMCFMSPRGWKWPHWPGSFIVMLWLAAGIRSRGTDSEITNRSHFNWALTFKFLYQIGVNWTWVLA